MRHAGWAIGDGDDRFNVAPPRDRVDGAVNALALKYQIGVGGHADGTCPALQASPAQQPIAEQGFTQRCRY
ncbi:hypothetical protein D3C86_1638930 [compost metagenome]